MSKLWPACLAVVACIAFPAAAKDAAAELPKPPQLYQQMLDCKGLTDPSARLACYDEKVGALAEATARREVVVTDQAEIRKTKRGLFGFSLPIGRLFGSSAEEESEAEEYKRLETTVESARNSRSGMMVLSFKEGGSWEQTDGTKGFAVKPKPGEKAVLTRGTFGSYFVKVEGQPGVRMRRIQ